MRMKRNQLHSFARAFALILSLAIVTTACEKESQKENPVFEGPRVSIGNGKTYTWVKLRADGNPDKLGITLTKDALENLPQDPNDHHHNTFTLQLHQKASAIPFDHVTVDWNPVGHPPQNLFMVPHFDFHFYAMTQGERAQIPPYQVDPSKHDILPPAEYMPQDYQRIPEGVPAMGVHWADMTAPEFNGEPFTYSFLYGSYNGKVTFLEPMVKYQFLKDGGTVNQTIKQPQKYMRSGFYPTKFRIYKENDLYQVVLEDFVYRTQS